MCVDDMVYDDEHTVQPHTVPGHCSVPRTAHDQILQSMVPRLIERYSMLILQYTFIHRIMLFYY